jgi:flavocytochrome c
MSSEEKGKNKISRRDFIRVAAVGSAALASTVTLAGCATTTAAPTDTPMAEQGSTPYDMPAKWDKETDVVVVGTGDAGSLAALNAFDGGASVIMIDKNDYYGGCSTLGGGNCQLVATHVQAGQGIEDHAEWGYEDQMILGLYRSHPDLLNLWTERSDDVTVFMEEKLGMVYGKVGQQEGARVPRSHIPAAYGVHPDGRGIIMVMHYFKGVEERKIPVLLEHRMMRIYREPQGPVVGIEVESPDGVINIKAKKAVILATGGFKSNHQMLYALHPHMDEEFIWSGWPIAHNTGDGHLAAMQVGGGLVDVSFICEFSGRLGSQYYIRWDKPYFDNPSINTGLPNSKTERTIMVENDGNRFLNEAVWEAGHTLVWTEHMLAYLDIPKRPRAQWFINDQDGAETIGWDAFIDSFQNPNPEVTPCLDPEWVAMADTIAELAVKIGVPAENLEATIARYNEMAAAGVDDDFGREGPLYPIVKPPFWAARWCRMTHDQSTGIRVNKKMQILDTSAQLQPWSAPIVPMSEEAVIPHLYAAGECTGGTGGAIRGSGKRGWYQVHGLVAGEWAAKEPSLS